MVGENLQSHLVLLLRPPDLVVQLGVVQSQPAVHGERLEGLLVLLTWDDNNKLGDKVRWTELTRVKIPSPVFLLIIWTTPMTVPRMQIGMQRMDLVV